MNLHNWSGVGRAGDNVCTQCGANAIDGSVQMDGECPVMPGLAFKAGDGELERLQTELTKHNALLLWLLKTGPRTKQQGDAIRAAIAEMAEQNLSGARPPAAARDDMEKMAFVYVHPKTGERHTVTVSRKEVTEHMEEELFSKLCDCFCSCESVGETNVVDCRCDEVGEQFELVKQQDS